MLSLCSCVILHVPLCVLVSSFKYSHDAFMNIFSFFVVKIVKFYMLQGFSGVSELIVRFP